ncbi:MAG: extracellular solute-binding protein [Eubacteriales bacterium]|nr:extracellular solute-binding protein [Eubacteriales bacterium]
MKKILALVLVTALLMSICVTFGASAESAPLGEITIMTTYWTPFDPENNLIKYVEEATGVKINIDYNLSADYATKVNSVLMSGELPDVIIGASVTTLMDQGAIVPITQYLTEEKLPHMVAGLEEDDYVYLKSATDGEVYSFPYKHKMPEAMSFIIRTDWLEKLNLEKPQTWEEWLTAWRAIRDQDANGNGDAADEIPFTGNAYSLMPAFGIPVSCQSQGNYVTTMPDGTYNLIWEHPNYRVYLENMAMMYSEGLLDTEFASRTLTESYAVMNSGIGGSMQAFAEQSLTTTTALREVDPSMKCECIEPVEGPLGDKLIPSRSTIAAKGCVTVSGEEKIDLICKVFDYLWSDEGMLLMNYGVEGYTFEYDADHNPKIISPYVDSFANARGAGLNFQMLPTCWTLDSYMQILCQGKSYDELPEANKFFYDGLFLNDPYFVKLAPQIATDAYSTYSADIIPAVLELQANAIAGRISIDEFFTGYEALKSQGLQEMIDANAAASAMLN